MRCELNELTRKRTRAWFAHAPGRWFQAEERHQLAQVLPNLFGYHLLQLGDLYSRECLTTTRIPHCVVLVATVRALKMHGGGPKVTAGKPLDHLRVSGNVIVSRVALNICQWQRIVLIWCYCLIRWSLLKIPTRSYARWTEY